MSMYCMVLILALSSFLLSSATENDRMKISPRVKEMVSKLTLREKIGQMTQINIDFLFDTTTNTLKMDVLHQLADLGVGSILNSPFAGGVKLNKFGFSATEWRDLIASIQKVFLSKKTKSGETIPIIYGIDSVHGAGYVSDAALFGQQINGAATFNPKLVFEMARVTAKDTLAGAMPWIFGPILGISTSQRWARVYETFGEDPVLASAMGAALVKGLQDEKEMAACMKHFIAYSKPSSGHDRDDVVLSDFDLLNYYAPSFQAAVKAGSISAMNSYNSINGEPIAASKKWLRDLLRHDMGFKGMMVTDWAEINNLHGFHRIATSQKEAVRMALGKTSIDMSMVPMGLGFVNQTYELVKEGRLSEDRLTESVERIIQMKQTLGLFENPLPGKKFVDTVGQDEDRQFALDMARESTILLKNTDNVLPLSAEAKETVFLTGPSVDNIGHLCGGWTIHWQGTNNDEAYPHGTSIKTGIEQLLNMKANTGKSLLFHPGVGIDGKDAEGKTKALEMAANSKYTIVVIGEPVYTEKPGDINDLSLPAGQLQYVRDLVKTGTKVILVLVEGRTRLLHGIADEVHAVVHALLPCEQGGKALAEILYGKVNPSGRLPLTYPKTSGNIDIPYYHRQSTMCESNWANSPCNMEWKFGEGMSYTTFKYSNMKISESEVSGPSSTLDVSVTVTNEGKMDGKETVLLFLSQAFRSYNTPEVKMLKKFNKIFLKAGESQVVTFTLEFSDWAMYQPQVGHGFLKKAEKGDYYLAFGYDTTCDMYSDKPKENALCKKFTVTDTSC